MSDFCVMPDCMHPQSPQLPLPICTGHARQIYLHVKDMMAAATITQRGAAARPPKSRSGMRNRIDQSGHVYFMLMEPGVIKVGFSTDVKARARQLGAREVLATVPGTRRDERALHAKFGPHWIEGECFHDCPEIRAYIERAA